MTNQLIFVADGDPKNVSILQENLEASGFRIQSATEGNKAWEDIQKHRPDIILSEINLHGMNGFQLLEKLQSNPTTSNIPFLFLTNQRELQLRVRSFQMGAKDYMVKPLHVKEVIAHIRMVQRRIQKRQFTHADDDSLLQFSGVLNEISVSNLIETFTVERKTGILTLQNGSEQSGKIFFRDGTIVNANYGELQHEKAIYHMLPWKKGTFQMIFKDVDIRDEISVSNLGILLEANKQDDRSTELLKSFPSPKMVFTITDTFKKLSARKKLPEDVRRFIALIDGTRTIQNIVTDSVYNEIKTLERLLRLYEQGFIEEKQPDVKHIDEQEVSSLISHDIFEDHDDSDVDIPPPPVEKVIAPEPPEIKRPVNPILERIEKRRSELILPDDENGTATPVTSFENTLDDETATPTIDLTRIDQNNHQNVQEDVLASTNEFEEKSTSEEEIHSPAFLENDQTAHYIEDDDDEDDMPGFLEAPELPQDYEESDRPISNIDQSPPPFVPSFTDHDDDMEDMDDIEDEIESYIEPSNGVHNDSPQAETIDNTSEFPMPRFNRDEFIKKQQQYDEIDSDSEIDNQEDEIDHDIEIERPSSNVSVYDKQVPIEQKKTTPTVVQEKNQIITIGLDEDSLDEVMDILTNNTFQTREIEALKNIKVHFGKIALNNFDMYTLLGVNADEKFSQLLTGLSRSLRGALFVIDATREPDWDYLKYLVQSISSSYSLPYSVAVTNFHDQHVLSIEIIRYKLGISEDVSIVAWDPVETAGIRKLLDSAVHARTNDMLSTNKNIKQVMENISI
ncbi:response regulator [candidate division KSB1 bacterium]|nr:response regulator [candidate division KSB1 bacterium]